MNPEIVKGQIRSIIISLGGIGAGYFMAKGWLTPEANVALTPIFASFATMAAGYIWSAMSHTEKYAAGVVVEIAKDPASPVRGLITENTVAGHKLAQTIDGPIAPAGSAAADKINRA